MKALSLEIEILLLYAGGSLMLGACWLQEHGWHIESNAPAYMGKSLVRFANFLQGKRQ